MPIEVEQKFRVAEHGPIERQLAELNAQASETIFQLDRYFNHPQRDFAQTDEALRLRRVGQRNFITYKGPKLDTTTKTRHEIEIELSSGEAAATAAAELVEALGFKPVAEVRKRRTHVDVSWEGYDVSVALDELETLGSFVELEIVAPQNQVAKARECLASLARRLGLTDAQRRSYLELLVSKR